MLELEKIQISERNFYFAGRNFLPLRQFRRSDFFFDRRQKSHIV